jgi:hypothetical protein
MKLYTRRRKGKNVQEKEKVKKVVVQSPFRSVTSVKKVYVIVITFPQACPSPPFLTTVHVKRLYGKQAFCVVCI